jgi:hypothetical protein
MREGVNVPFSFAVLEHDGARRPRGFRSAARVLRLAVDDLVHWDDPPGASAESREVFYTYARHLEWQVAQLELATRRDDTDDTGARLEAIRGTCDRCHHFFRPGVRP